MKILKKPDNLVFNTETPNNIEFSVINSMELNPLHKVTNKSDWDFLHDNFLDIEKIKHPILNNFANSYYYFLED